MKVALLGDVMLGRGVGERLQQEGPCCLFADDLVAVLREADLTLANLECCISRRGRPAEKRFVFRAPPVAVDALVHLGITGVTLANNHSLDFGEDALVDTLAYLDRAGIVHVGAGVDAESAQRAVVFDAAGTRLRVLAFSDHPREFAAGEARAGVAYVAAGAERGCHWLNQALDVHNEAILVTPHWGPNMRSTPTPSVRRTAEWLLGSGATLVAGHSAHVFQGVVPRCVFDLGDFVDDYARDPQLRNDLGILTFVTFEGTFPTAVEVVPLELDYCFTKLARGAALEDVVRRYVAACRALGTDVERVDGRLRIDWHSCGDL